ncbi:MAG TPA: cell division protein ZapA [Gammaproteobacteria bacterium]|nr:cell division protein ZapA [Gammaproteobacteria bacterium]
MGKRIEITILGKVLQVEAPDEAGVQQLHTVARALDSKLQQLRILNQTMPTERVVIMAALNIMHELLSLQAEKEQIDQELKASVKKMQEWIEA